MMANGRKNWDVVAQGRILVCNRGMIVGERKTCGGSFSAYPSTSTRSAYSKRKGPRRLPPKGINFHLNFPNSVG